jgi:flagellar biosynthesis protein FliQ
VTTAGAGNPVLSLIEDAGSGLLVVVAFVLPVLAFLLVVGLLVALFVGWRRVRRRRAAARAPA